MMVGKVAYNGCTFYTANKLQRWLKDQIESEMGTGAQHLLPVSIDIPTRSPREGRTCQAWVQLASPTVNNIWTVSDIITRKWFGGVQLYAEPSTKPATHHLSTTKVYSWSAAKGSQCNRSCTLCRTTERSTNTVITTAPTPRPLMADLQSTRVVYCEQDVRFHQARAAQPKPEPPATKSQTTPDASSVAAVPTVKKYTINALRDNARMQNAKRAALAQLKPAPKERDLPTFRRLRKATRKRLKEPARGLRLLEVAELCRRGERPAAKKTLGTWQQQSPVDKNHVFCSSFEEFKQKHGFGPKVEEEKVEEERKVEEEMLDLDLVNWFDDQDFF